MYYSFIKKIDQININIILKKSLSFFSLFILLGFFNPISGSTKSRYSSPKIKLLEENNHKKEYQLSKVSWEKLEDKNTPKKKIRWQPIDNDHYDLIKESFNLNTAFPAPS